MKALVGAFNQEKALVGAFSVIVQPVVEPMDRFTALMSTVVPVMAAVWWQSAGVHHLGRIYNIHNITTLFPLFWWERRKRNQLGIKQRELLFLLSCTKNIILNRDFTRERFSQIKFLCYILFGPSTFRDCTLLCCASSDEVRVYSRF